MDIIHIYRHIYTCITHINVYIHTHTTEDGKRPHHIVAEEEEGSSGKRRKQDKTEGWE